jgi:hypothetical protein
MLMYVPHVGVVTTAVLCIDGFVCVRARVSVLTRP